MHVVLLEPEIPGNTGNIIRLCANTGCSLHLVGPLGFSMSDRLLKRAGLDYHEYVTVQRHDNMQALRLSLPASRVIAFSARGERPHSQWQYAVDDILLFGPETRGLPESERMQADGCLRIPMRAQVRSLNLSNSVAIAVYEAWRQLDYAGIEDGSG